MENKYIIKFPTKAKQHIKMVIKNSEFFQPYEINRFLFNKELINLTRCRICRKRNTYRQFFYQNKIHSVCEKCFNEKNIKTIDLIYFGRPVELIENNTCDSNIEIVTNFYEIIFRNHYGGIYVYGGTEYSCFNECKRCYII